MIFLRKLTVFLGLLVLITAVGCYSPAVKHQVNSNELKATEITPYFEQKITQSKNLIYCSTFQLAWNEFKNNVIKGDIQLADEPPMVKHLNKSNVSRQDISDKDYVAMIGQGKDNIISKINQELKNKFANPPGVSDQLYPDDIFAYAYLYKKLDFATQFAVCKTPVNFKGVKVKSFGIEKYTARKSRQMASQVEVYDYVNDDDFIVKLIPKNDNEEIVLAKIQPETSLDLTYQAVENRIKSSKVVALQEDDSLKIPAIEFDITKSYDALLHKLFLNSEWQGYYFFKALQTIDFRLNERGASLKSEAKLGATKQATSAARNLVFDKPFLLYLKEKQADNPYLAIWVNQPEIMLEQ